MRSIQALFDRLKRRINRRLEGIQSPDLATVHTMLAVLMQVVEDLYTRPFLSILIIEKIIYKKVTDI